MRGYKVTDCARSRICGIACDSLKQLKLKGCKKLQLDAGTVIVRLQDGTFVDDEEYFMTLPPQTLFLLANPDQSVVTGYEILYNMLCTVHKEYTNVGKMASDFLSQDMKKKVREIASILEKQSSENRSKLSKRVEDPEWFEGLETHATSKEAFMFKRSQERIRGYLYKSQDDIKRSQLYIKDVKARAKLDSSLSLFKLWLKQVDHFGCYFSRNCINHPPPLQCYCEASGQFQCQGKWNDSDCRHSNSQSSANNAKHSINPYESKEARIVFSTWNLDHRIERSRQIGPSILEAAKLAVGRDQEINSLYFFSLLFTSNNLKLVHIVCHDKGEHTGAVCTLKKLTVRKQDATNFRPSVLVQPA